MINFLDKFIKSSNNLDSISSSVKKLSEITPVKKIFDSVNKFSLIVRLDMLEDASEK